MKLLDEYLVKKQELFDYFGYVEDWRVLPLDDARGYFWQLFENEHDGGCVRFAEEKEALKDEDSGDYFENEIYTQRHLPKWVYRGIDCTMIVVDTHTDGNQFLQIFDNSKEIK